MTGNMQAECAPSRRRDLISGSLKTVAGSPAENSVSEVTLLVQYKK